MSVPKAVIDIIANVKRFLPQMKTVQATLVKVKEKMKGVARAAKIMLLGTAAAIGVTIKQASDAAETLSKFEAVFKDQSKAALEFADTLAKTTNRSKEDLIGFLATLQDTFVPFGFARKEARLLSQQLVALAVDMASFNNASEPEVLASLQTALVGNVEAVRKFGIVITQNVLNQELMSKGIKGGTKVATEQEKVLARLAIILRSTVDAQGDAARTSGSFENQMKGLLAAIKTLSITIGDTFLPVAAKFVAKATEAAKSASQWAGRNKTLILGLTAVTLATGAAIPTLVAMAGGLAQAMVAAKLLRVSLAALNIQLLLSPLGILITLLTALAIRFSVAAASSLDAQLALEAQEQEYIKLADAIRLAEDARKRDDTESELGQSRKIVRALQDQIDKTKEQIAINEAKITRRNEPDRKILLDEKGKAELERLKEEIKEMEVLIGTKEKIVAKVKDKIAVLRVEVALERQRTDEFNKEEAARKRLVRMADAESNQERKAGIRKAESVAQRVAAEELSRQAATSGRNLEILQLEKEAAANEKLRPQIERLIALKREQFARDKRAKDRADDAAKTKSLQAQTDALRKQQRTKEQIANADKKRITLLAVTTDLTEKEAAAAIARIDAEGKGQKVKQGARIGIETLTGAFSRISNAAARTGDDAQKSIAKNTKLTADQLKAGLKTFEDIRDGITNIPQALIEAGLLRA